MTINTQHNGYAIGSKLTEIKEKFEEATRKLFGDEVKEINHFYYGDKLIMSDIKLNDKHYGQFNLTAKRVSFNGHTCTFEQYDKFSLLTLNDELFKGKLLEL
jgi:hypothetical protein